MQDILPGWKPEDFYYKVYETHPPLSTLFSPTHTFSFVGRLSNYLKNNLNLAVIYNKKILHKFQYCKFFVSYWR